MYNKKLSILVIHNALETLGVSLPNFEARHLVGIVGKSPTEAAALQAIRLIVAQFMTDPSAVLATKGVGVKTFATIQKLTKLVSSATRKKDLGLKADIEVAITLLRRMNSTMPNQCTKAHDAAKEAVSKLESALANHHIEVSLTKQVKKTTPTKK